MRGLLRAGVDRAIATLLTAAGPALVDRVRDARSHGITDALRDAELLAGQVISALCGDVPEDGALALYQTTRERLSRQLFEVTGGVAAYDWDADGIRTLLHRFSDAMRDEVEHLEALTHVG